MGCRVKPGNDEVWSVVVGGSREVGEWGVVGKPSDRGLRPPESSLEAGTDNVRRRRSSCPQLGRLSTGLCAASGIVGVVP